MAREKIADDIKRHLFGNKVDDSQLIDLSDAYDKLESSLERMMTVQWDSAINDLRDAPGEAKAQEVEDKLDERFRVVLDP